MRLVSVLAFAAAPFIGFFIYAASFAQNSQALELPLEKINTNVIAMERSFNSLQENTDTLHQTAANQEQAYKEQENFLDFLTSKSLEHKRVSDQIYEDRILAMLGPPVGVHTSQRVQVKVFKLDELGYRGYIAKVKLFDPAAFRVVLAGDRLGETETTGSAVARTGAVLGINGGGFYSLVQDGRKTMYPIGNTVIDGKFIGGFNPADDVFFAGIQQSGKFIGGIFPQKDLLTSLNPWQGASFLPVLIQNGRPLPLPGQWASTKQPRTIIGEYANGDLILIVVDGRHQDWSSGVTLERLQVKLAELGVKEGYNLDGGGSSAFVFQGKLLNRPSDGKQRPVVTNFVVLP